ncbi:hypothetical protein [Agrococcus casei]|uniref:Uncharacterized protein n=1 Tax=Agrococcus casei LMG 22410 TaxID=1255656 RepID=A0A1R4GF59_9MICO|nr:hypothetical protein [Agrococcus casei]SJM66800.1 hypothetical protein CZ674_11480 [Agrococcus casei LMG 22410]
MSAVDYIALELFMQPLEDFILGHSRLALARLGIDPDQDAPRWIDVKCDLSSITARSGGNPVDATTAIDAGYLSFIAHNALNPVLGYDVYPGTLVRLRDTSSNETLWTGALDDIDVAYEKQSDDYTVTINASDAIRELKATMVRGAPGDIDATNPPVHRIDDRVEQLAAAANVTTDLDSPAHGWVTQSASLGAWERFGTRPTGYNYGPVDAENRLFINDTIDAVRESISMTSGQFGMQRLATGLTIGTIYRFYALIGVGSGSGSVWNFDESLATFAVGTDSGERSIGVQVAHNGRKRYAVAEVIFKATSTTRRLRVFRDYTGELPHTDVTYNIGYGLLEQWQPGSPLLPLQPVAYQSNAYNHLVMAADSAGQPWHIDRLGRLATKPAAAPRADLSDQHSSASTHLCYVDVDAGYSTSDTVNTLDIDNRGRQPSHEQADAWIVHEEPHTLTSPASVARYRPRPMNLATQLPDALLPGRANAIFTTHDTPHETIRSITVEADKQPLARSLELGDRITARFRDISSTYRIAGIAHHITPRRHRITYETRTS